MPRSTRALAAVALLAAALMGCGRGDEGAQAYVQGLNSAQERFATSVGRLSGAITPTSSERSDRRTLDRYRRAVDRVVGDLRAIEPPADVRGLHARLVGTLAGYGRTVHVARDALDERDPGRLRAAQRELERRTTVASTRIQGTIGAINRELDG